MNRIYRIRTLLPVCSFCNRLFSKTRPTARLARRAALKSGSCAATIGHRRRKKPAADCHPPLHLRTVAAFGRKPLNFHAPGGFRGNLTVAPLPRTKGGFRLTEGMAGGKIAA